MSRRYRGLGPGATALALTLVAGSGAPARDAEPVTVHTRDIAVSGDVAVLGRTGGIITLDVSDPVRPREIGRMGVHATILAVRLEGERAWLAAGAQGVALADLSDPTEPRLEWLVDVVGRVREVLPLGDRVLLAESREGLNVYDLSDPERPRRTASLSTRAEVRALALEGELLATAEELAGVRLFDVRSPDHPHELALIEVEGARDVAFVDGRLLVAAGRRGVVVVDTSEPRSPKIVGEIAPVRSAVSVARFGRLALVGNESAGIQGVDPFHEEGPRARAHVPLSSRYPAGRVAAEGSVAYIAADRAGFVMIDLADLDAPRMLHPPSRRMHVK